MLQSERPNLAEVQLREEIRDEVIAELSDEQRAEAARDRDRRVMAFIISATVALSFALPLTALVVGLSWRIFKWAAGVG